MEGDNSGAPKSPGKCLRLDIKRNSIFENGVPVRNGDFVNEAKRRSKEDISSNFTDQIGIIGGGALILQTVIGPGIFTSPKGVADFGGSIGVSYIIWALSGIFSTLAALCFVELQLSVPRAGCEYGYIHKAFGKLPTFIYTWMRIALAEPATTAVFCIAFADYVADSIHDKCGPSESNRKLLAIFAVVTLTLLNGMLKRMAKVINYASNCGKIVALTIVISGGIYNISRNSERAIKEGFEFSKTNYHALCMAFYNSLWAYSGWANVPHVTTGVRKPPKNLPLLILIVIPFVTLLYLVTVTSFFSVLTRDELIGAEAIGVGWGEELYKPLGYVIPIFVCLIAFGNANGTFMQAGRTASVAVHDGYIPELLSYIHVRTKIHVPAVAGRCFATIVLICAVEVGALVRFYVFTVWLFHGLTVCGLLTLRYRRKKAYDRQFQVPIIVPILVLIFSIGLVAGPFTVWPPKLEFAFSIGVLVLSIILFIPFGKAKGLAHLFDRVVVFVQLLMNVVPPNIQRHKTKVINVRRKSTFSPSLAYAPRRRSIFSRRPSNIEDTSGTFSPAGLDANDNFQWPNYPDAYRQGRSRQDKTDLNRSLSTPSFNSLMSVDYCGVMNKFDEASNDMLETNSMASASYPPSLFEFRQTSYKTSPIYTPSCPNTPEVEDRTEHSETTVF